LPVAIQRFLKRFPRAEVNVQEDVTAHLVEAVAAAELDLAVVALPIPDERLQAEALFSEPLFLTLSRRHPLARKRQLTLNDLSEEPFIILHEMHCLGAQVLSFCRASGCQPRIACRSAQIATIQTLIAAGQGISILPDMARRADRDRRRLYRRLTGDGLTRTVAVIRHRHRYLCPAAERFLTTLRELAAEHVTASDP
jgi:LysR family hydrogen peroxide-inducible transcriptional activator